MSQVHTQQPSFHDPSLVAAHTDLLRVLRTFLPDDAVLAQEEELRPYECDALSAYRQLPLLVVLPRTLEEVRRIMRLCHERHIPMVARGAGAGVSGGALPHGEGVLLSLARLDRILDIERIGRTARVQPGVRNPGHLRGCGPLRPLLCPGPVLADCLHHRRQCGGKLRRRTLPQVRADGA